MNKLVMVVVIGILIGLFLFRAMSGDEASPPSLSPVKIGFMPILTIASFTLIGIGLTVFFLLLFLIIFTDAMFH